MRPLFTVIALASLLAACTRPPPEAYVAGAATHTGGTAVGNDSRGESCTLFTTAAGTADVYCAAWQFPAARIRDGGAGTAADLNDRAAAGAWRDALALRYTCSPPTGTSILGGAPAVLLQCRERVGGWPHVAVVAAVAGHIWQADGILPAMPAIERGIGVLSGTAAASGAAMSVNAADTLLANQLAAHAFGAGDVDQYQRLMALGARANLAENFAAAETAYRAALALQQRVLGADDPDTVTPLMHLALQLSDQGRFSEAEPLFQKAEALAPRASDAAAEARLEHYRGLHEMNQRHFRRALALLRRAEAGYARLVPPESLTARPATGTSGLVDLPSYRLLVDPTAQSALMGLIETRRYQAIALHRLGRDNESAAALASAETLAQANRMVVPLVAARLDRTAGTLAGGSAFAAQAALSASRQNFNAVLPGTRPVAETMLLQAGDAARAGATDRAIALCGEATALLRDLRAGTRPALLAPCLASYAAAAAKDSGQSQKLLAEMFTTAELAQGTVTSQQIGEAAARLAAQSRDPHVAEAIRRRQDAAETLADLYRQRDILAERARPGGAAAMNGLTDVVRVDPAKLDHDIAAAQAELAAADAALQVAAPNYGQLVQQVVPAAEVLRALAPDEAFVAVTLAGQGGWTFVLRHGQIAVAPVTGGTQSVAALVNRIRASVDPTTGGLPSFDAAAAEALYRATLGPLAPQIDDARSLIIAPSGPLLALPFAVLLTGPTNPADLAHAPWLVRRFAIAHVPSAANFVALRKAGRSQAAQPWFGFGGFRPVTLAQAEATFPAAACRDSARLFASLPPLPFTLRELDAARSIVGGSASDELLGNAFTADAVLRTPLRGYRILHFATHALLPAELRCENQPAIVTSAPPRASTAAGALLTANEVIGLHLNADLVILSACNSGGPGGTTGGESLSGLARAFFYSGARAMLVTHWSVNDQASAFLIADTLRHWQAEPAAGLAAALRAAQLDMLNAAGTQMPAAVADPYFWAPFALIGESGATRSQTAGL